MSTPQAAGASEILRSKQKDDEYLRYLRNLSAEITQKCFGIPFWIRWKDLTSVLSDSLFYSLTTLSGFQTLGEEYTNVIQVNRNLNSVPSYLVRFSDVILRTFGQYFLLKWQCWLENELDSVSHVKDENSHMIYLPIILKTIAILQRLHLIAFYLYGNYYHITRRLLGIKYVVIRRWLSQSSGQTPYTMMGYLALTQLCLSLIVSLYSCSVKNAAVSVVEKTEESSKEVISSKQQCLLCFEERHHSTATPCGHLFCWSCITSWMQNKEECPLCRESFPPSKLIFLQNYD